MWESLVQEIDLLPSPRPCPSRAGARASDDETGGQLGDVGVWVHNDEPFGPAGPELSQQDPEQPIRPTQARSGPLLLEHSKLLAKAKHFEGRLGAAADEQPNHDQECEHGSTVVAHRNAAETRPVLCAQAVEFGASPLLATHSHFSDVPPGLRTPIAATVSNRASRVCWIGKSECCNLALVDQRSENHNRCIATSP